MTPRSPYSALGSRATASIALVLAATTAARAQTAATAPVVTSTPLTFSGEVRTRSEWDAPNGLSADAFTSLRTRFGVRVDPAPGATLVLQLQDSRVLGTEGNTISSTMDVFDLHQGYLQLGGGWQSLALSARAGRQEIAIGNERLVGSVNWSNTGRSFDGVRLSASPLDARTGAEPWTATAFAAIVEEHGRRFGGAPAAAAASVPDHSMAGAYLTARLNGTSNADVTLLYDGGARYRNYTGADRTTLDGRIRTTVAGVALEGEGAVQSGSQRVLLADTTKSVSQQVRAWLVGARLGVPMGSRAVATLGVDVLSGDATPADERYTAFGTMFATNHPFYGLMDVIGDPAASTRERGLVDAIAMATARVSPSFAPKLELHRFTLAGGGATLGAEGDLIAPLRLSAASTVELGYSLFRAGRAAGDVGLGADGSTRQWMYLQLRAGF